MKSNIPKKLSRRKRKILRRLEKANQTKYRKAAAGAGPELARGGLKYELSDKTQGVVHGGIPLMIALAQRALHAPVDNLTSNWAYMLMTSLAWTLKAWAALQIPVDGRWKEKHTIERETILRMEFKTFVNGLIRVPVQVVRKSRRRILRVLSWNEFLPAFFRLSQVLQL